MRHFAEVNGSLGLNDAADFDAAAGETEFSLAIIHAVGVLVLAILVERVAIGPVRKR